MQVQESDITRAPESGVGPVLGKTLPALLYEASARYANPRALNRKTESGWQPLSLEEFRIRSEETALGLRTLNMARGETVAFFMDSDVDYCIADMGCLLAGLISVPIYLSHGHEAIAYVINHSEASAIIVSNVERLKEVTPVFADTPGLRIVAVAEVIGDEEDVPMPEHVQLVSMGIIQQWGRSAQTDDPTAVDALLSKIEPDHTATIIYTSGTTGTPKGVMLSHENISYNALTSFAVLEGYVPGPQGETAISFLPLTHIFARTLHYGYLYYGTSVFFSRPDSVAADMASVRPTIFATVPRVLEKIYSSIVEKGAGLSGARKKIFDWAMRLARAYELGATQGVLFRLRLAFADLLVYGKWRGAFGGRVKFIIVGGAALDRGLANMYAAAGINCLQGYGLTETSPVITYNRPRRNRAGFVGQPIPGAEVTIAGDGEVLARGPMVMKGYYKMPDKTREVINEEGWFHTGDIGEVGSDGFLRITDRKKDLFKLSTGKYVMPQPLESRLTSEPGVAQVVVVGANRKFCSALIFIEEDHLRVIAPSLTLEPGLDVDVLINRPEVLQVYQSLVDNANQGMDHWSTIKRFRLLTDEFTVENGLITPTLKVKRRAVYERFGRQIDALYDVEPDY